MNASHPEVRREERPTTESPSPSAERPTRVALLWVANLLTITRLVGAPFLLVPAAYGHPRVFFVAFLLLVSTDWFDGRFARWVAGRNSAFGARLDSLADLVLFSMLPIGLWWLQRETIVALAPWIGAVLVTWVFAVALSLVRFRAYPGLHTFSAKTAWWLVNLGLGGLLVLDLTWPIRVGLVAVVVANVESALITFLLPKFETDVPSLLHLRGRLRSPRC